MTRDDTNFNMNYHVFMSAYLMCDVPQGSIIGPPLFSEYMHLLLSVIYFETLLLLMINIQYISLSIAVVSRSYSTLKQPWCHKKKYILTMTK